MTLAHIANTLRNAVSDSLRTVSRPRIEYRLVHLALKRLPPAPFAHYIRSLSVATRSPSTNGSLSKNFKIVRLYIAVDRSGNVYVADTNKHCVQKFVVNTRPGTNFSDDASSCRLRTQPQAELRTLSNWHEASGSASANRSPAPAGLSGAYATSGAAPAAGAYNLLDW